ncbi:hypothetical protein AVDCRST_MAG94-4365 [uncultured Leptolyngbya sp.]|uniref:Uncharacterized protein n=1 Tax=uncultured Leptolyngbya sp. TaxID=332963 RepID=A0A6J4N5G9_9CYAN|nr:hypothetical protein AVDCRST_MAG94-4365 [uncultured Leptolyngbya sp.]
MDRCKRAQGAKPRFHLCPSAPPATNQTPHDEAQNLSWLYSGSKPVQVCYRYRAKGPFGHATLPDPLRGVRQRTNVMNFAHRIKTVPSSWS